jgi:aryl-alcohol dehydrogenase-like predicted oxidoreductase
MSISRRTFLTTTALTGAAGEMALVTADEERAGIPARILGKTGARVSILAYGCGSSFAQYGTFEEALTTLTRALDLGISYIDTAAAYGDGQSEKIAGALMKTRRKDVWLATKIRERGYDEVMRLLDESLARLRTDRVDLLHVHDLKGVDDLAAIESPNGALKAFYRIRDEKKARFIGITSHSDPAVLKTALERHDFDCTQMSLNPALRGARGHNSFESLALPVAVRKKMGVIAMKVFAQARYKAPAAQLMRYALSLPVGSAAIGMPTLKVLEEDVRIAKAFQPMPDSEMRKMAAELSAAHKDSLDRFFRRHEDA